jgi:hypothetical protein
MRGVIALAVASVFLLALFSSAAKLSARQPDYSYQHLSFLHLQQSAVENSFFDSMSDAAGKSYSAHGSGGIGAHDAMRAAVYLAALDFEAQMKANGHEAVFWCRRPSDAALLAASQRMHEEGKPAAPQGALLLSSPECAMEFDINLLSRKVRVREVGYSLYSRQAGAGYAAQFPENYGAEFGSNVIGIEYGGGAGEG